MKALIQKATTLIEALPYIRAFSGKTLVIKYGGAAMVERTLRAQFAEDVVLMKYVGIHPVVVHGGGPQINEMLRRVGKEPSFVQGMRVTDPETMGVVEMVLSGMINQEIVLLINQYGGRAVGLTGKDGRLLTAKPLKASRGKRRGPSGALGLVGEVQRVDPQILKTLEGDRFIPVIAPVAAGPDGKTYNVNADLVAGAIAAALRAEKLLVLTDVPGIQDGKGRPLSSLTRKETQRLITRGVITGGMVPKVRAALAALDGGVKKAHIIAGRTPHALLLEVFTDKGIGTEILP